MEIRYTKFDEADVEKYCMGAGVIPVSMNQTTKEPHLLLGRERWVPMWKGSCRWSGFEGARKSFESVLSSASREFKEECLDVFPEAENKVVRGEHWFRVVLRVMSPDKIGTRFHVTYVVLVDWDATIPSLFQRQRKGIEKLDAVVQEWKYRAQKEDGNILHLKDRVEKYILSHPCVTVEREEASGDLTDVRIHKDYLEKDQIRWWSVSDLKTVLSNKGSHDTERFRPYFLPVLKTILAELERRLATS